MKLGEYSIDIYKEGINGKDKRNEYLLKKLQELDSEAKEAEDTRYFEVNIDGWIFWVNKDNQEIEIQGEEKNPLVRIKEIKLTTSTNSIKVDVEVKRGEGAKYKYYYKKQDTTDAFKLAKETNSTSYTIENLEQNVTYVIKVEATNENGTVSKEAVGRTGEIPDAQGAIEFSSPIWNNGKAEVTITKTTNDSMKIQYRVTVGETIGEYQEIASGEKITNLELGSIVTARLWDGTNVGNTANLNIQDLVAPTVTITKGEITSSSIEVSITAVDNEAGMPSTPSHKYYIKESTETGYTNSPVVKAQTSHKFTGLKQEVNYDIKVETQDKAGNIGTNEIKNIKTGKVAEAQGAIEFSSPIWNNGKAEVTIIKTTNDSMQIQYKIGIGTYQIIASGTKITNLELGSIVTARLWDGINGGNTTNISIQDLTNPNEATITLSKQTINVGETITADVSQSDNESGIDILRCKWIYNQTSTKLGEDETKYTGKFTSASETISLTTTNPGDYYLHVLTVDKAGNKTEKVSEKVTVKEIEVESISLDKTTLKIGLGKTSEALKVTFTPANAKDKTITWSSNPTTVATVTDGKVTGVAEGTATITATTANGKTATCNVTVCMTIAEAKAKVTSYATLQQYIGKEVIDYNPTAGGTWRIFYYDEAGEFGTAGKLYLKRDYVNKDITLSSYKSYTPSTQGLEIMKAMNPKWRDYPTAGANTIDLVNEHCVAWLCDPVNWTDYKTEEADYAIGSPSVEMYMKAFNVWKTGNKDATNLICKVESKYGYSVGANGTYDNSGYHTNDNTIEAGPNNIFMTKYGYWWLASTSYNSLNNVLIVFGDHAFVLGNHYSDAYGYGVCPVVSL